MDKNRILFVEGIDDQHTIWAICKHFKVEVTFVVEIPDGEGKINPRALHSEKGGIFNVLKATELNLIAGSSATERLGIVVDADNDLNDRWRKVVKILEKAGYQNLPDAPDEKGTIISQEFLPTFGIWIMPDNKITRGFLETFLAFLVPENDRSWQQAKSCVDSLEDKPFIKAEADHTEKAEIHTFLAWQEEPGKPFGTAITAKYLQADNPHCEKFVDWLNRLFVE